MSVENIPAKSREELLLKSMVTGDDVSNITPHSRVEMILKALASGEEASVEANSRRAALFAEALASNAGTGSDNVKFVRKRIHYAAQVQTAQDIFTAEELGNLKSSDYYFTAVLKLLYYPAKTKHVVFSINDNIKLLTNRGSLRCGFDYGSDIYKYGVTIYHNTSNTSCNVSVGGEAPNCEAGGYFQFVPDDNDAMTIRFIATETYGLYGTYEFLVWVTPVGLIPEIEV